MKQSSDPCTEQAIRATRERLMRFDQACSTWMSLAAYVRAFASLEWLFQLDDPEGTRRASRA